jgi:kumamolisin
MTDIQPDSSHTPAAAHSYLHMAHRIGNRPYIKFLATHAAQAAAPDATQPAPWNVADLCKAYDWPSAAPGGGKIAIVELGGGWLQSDVDSFFQGAGLPAPSITDVSVDATKNSPGVNSDSDGEVALDIQVAAAAYAVATGQAATIRMYWSSDIAAGVRAAMADGCDVCSISWGADEANWGKAAADAMEQAAIDATSAGMIVFAAAGDNDSSDGGPNASNVDVPASCPHVIGCGGTRKTPTAETVWNNDPGNASGEGTGGGFSKFFKPMPPWQSGAPHGRGRMVPDVAANADPVTGYKVIIAGTETPVGGTSAVAPLYSGLFAAFGTKLGWIGETIWDNHLAFNDISVGDNGKFRAREGPDACTGLGSPIGTKLLTLMLTTHGPNRMAALIAENAELREALAQRGLR